MTTGPRFDPLQDWQNVPRLLDGMRRKDQRVIFVPTTRFHMDISINGDRNSVPDGVTLARILELFNIVAATIVVAAQ